jgi:hypothetical protein
LKALKCSATLGEELGPIFVSNEIRSIKVQPAHVADLLDHVLHGRVLELASVVEDKFFEFRRSRKHADEVFASEVYEVNIYFPGDRPGLNGLTCAIVDGHLLSFRLQEQR